MVGKNPTIVLIRAADWPHEQTQDKIKAVFFESLEGEFMLHFKLSKQAALFLPSFILSTSMICSFQASAFDTLHKDIRFENNKFISKNPKVIFDNTEPKFKARVDLEQGGEFRAQWTAEKVGDETIGRFTEVLEQSKEDYTMSTMSFDSNGKPRSQTKCYGASNKAYCATATERLCERVRQARFDDDKLEKAVAKNKECAASLSYSKKIIDAMMRESSDYNKTRMATVEQDMSAMKLAMSGRKADERFVKNNISNVTTDSEAESMAQSFDQSFKGLRAIAELVEMCSTAGKFVKSNTSAAKPVPAKTGTN